jgi:hypothetical protein
VINFLEKRLQEKLCNIWIFYGGDYEECCLLGYKTPVIPHRGHYIPATDRSLLMLFKIWGFHGYDCEECRLLGSYRVALVRTDVSEENRNSIIKGRRIGELGKTLAVNSNRRTLPKLRFIQEPHSVTSKKAGLYKKNWLFFA